MRHIRFTWLAVLSALVLALPTAAALGPFGYSVVDGEMLRFDLSTGQHQIIGPTGTAGLYVWALTDGSDGSLFGLANNLDNPSSDNSLYRFDPATGGGEVIGAPFTVPGNHLAAAADGFFYSADSPGLIYRINPLTAAATQVADLQLSIFNLVAKDDALLITTFDSSGGCFLRRVDLGTFTMSLAGHAICAGTAAIGRDDGNLYLASTLVNVFDSSQGGRVARYDFSSQTTEFIGSWIGFPPEVRPLVGLANVQGGAVVEIPVAGHAGLLLYGALLSLAALHLLHRGRG